MRLVLLFFFMHWHHVIITNVETFSQWKGSKHVMQHIQLSGMLDCIFFFKILANTGQRTVGVVFFFMYFPSTIFDSYVMLLQSKQLAQLIV